MNEKDNSKTPSNDNKKANIIKDTAEVEIPVNYIISKSGVETLVSAIHDVVSSPHVRQVLFNVINDTFIPVKDETKDSAE